MEIKLGRFVCGYHNMAELAIKRGNCDVCGKKNEPVLEMEFGEYGGNVCEGCIVEAFFSFHGLENDR